MCELVMYEIKFKLDFLVGCMIIIFDYLINEFEFLRVCFCEG